MQIEKNLSMETLKPFLLSLECNLTEQEIVEWFNILGKDNISPNTIYNFLGLIDEEEETTNVKN